jgi:23S rRNA (cytosine1962-C5)-methyltransferase
MRYSKDLVDYELLDMANGEKLERWDKFTLIRPDPQIVWNKKTCPKLWEKADARYIRSSSGGRTVGDEK